MTWFMDYLTRKQLLIIIAAWCFMQLVLVYSFGINKNHEALAYLGLRDQWLQGNFNHYGHFWLYSGYVGLHVIIKKLGLHENMLYAVQLIASFAALFAFIKGTTYFTRHSTTVFISGLMYSTCFLLHYWTPFLYTESMFTSLITIAICSMLFYHSKPLYKWLFWLLLFCIPFFRPNGFLFMLIPILSWATQHFKKRKWEMVCLTALLFGFGKFAAWLVENSPYFYFIRPNAEADIVCSITSDLKQYIKVPWQEGMSLWQYFCSNPELTIRMLSGRLFKTLWMTRDHYSLANNLVTGASLLLYYFLALAGIWQLARHKTKDLIWLIAGMGLFIGPVVLMCADWNNRLINPFFPLLLWLAAAGTELLMVKKEKPAPMAKA